jgi:hypothetical protein
MARLHRAIPALAWALFGWLVTAGCGTDAVGTDACRRIEQARCRKAVDCPELGLQGATGVEECVQYARDRCLHGFAVADPGVPVIDACVSTIEQATTCDVIAAPENTPACAFLKPAAAGDAGPDAAADTAPEAGPEDASSADAPETAEGG